MTDAKQQSHHSCCCCCCGSCFDLAYIVAVLGIAITVGQYFYLANITENGYKFQSINFTLATTNLTEQEIQELNAFFNQTDEANLQLIKMATDNPKMYLLSEMVMEILPCVLLLIGLCTKFVILIRAYLFVKIFLLFIAQFVLIVFIIAPLVPLIWHRQTNVVLLPFAMLVAIFLLYDFLCLFAYFIVYRAYRQIKGQGMVHIVMNTGGKMYGNFG